MDDPAKPKGALSPEERAALKRRMAEKGLAGRSVDRGGPRRAAQAATAGAAPRARELTFSIFFFSADETAAGSDKYRLVLDAARWADRNDYRSVWTPERHFHKFGGLYPNPAVLSAALAVATERIGIRAGSLTSTLHHTIRIAEEWAVVDNLSGGRVGVSFASGWHPYDFVFAPDAYKRRREVMVEQIALVRRLWAGETVSFPGVDGKEVAVATLPRPVQKELPIWITSSGNVETWTRAAAVGANVMTALLEHSLEDVADKTALYRGARAEAGLDPAGGEVALMLHTYVGDDLEAVRSLVKEPMRQYLLSHVGQFATLVGTGELGVDMKMLEARRDRLVSMAVQRYFRQSSLLGTPESCLEMLARAEAADVDEILCFLDFGLPYEDVMRGLDGLNALRALYRERRTAGALLPAGGTAAAGAAPA